MRIFSRLFQATLILAVAFIVSGCMTAKEMPAKADAEPAEPAQVAQPTPTPVVDSDGDGVADDDDKCPGTPAGTEVDETGCERDDDGDGVPNSKDACPNTAAGAKVNRRGCTIIASIEGVNFAFDSAELTDEGKAVLGREAQRIKANPTARIQVAGHTDSIGSEEYNQGLSERRAAAVRSHLISEGVAGTRLVTIGYGETQPIATNDTREGRAQNRRVELVDISQ